MAPSSPFLKICLLTLTPPPSSSSPLHSQQQESQFLPPIGNFGNGGDFPNQAPLSFRAPVPCNGGDGASDVQGVLPTLAPSSSNQVLIKLYHLVPWLSAIASDTCIMTAMATPQNSSVVAHSSLHPNQHTPPSQVVSFPSSYNMNYVMNRALDTSLAPVSISAPMNSISC